MCSSCRAGRIKKYGKIWRAHNREWLLEEKRQDYRENKTKYNALGRLWRKANPERKRELNRRHKRLNPQSAYRWDRANPKRIKRIKDKYHLRIKYGLTTAERDAMYQMQNQCCAICKKAIPPSGNHNHIDHDHELNKVRSILCARCNHIVGILENFPDLVAAAQKYITDWKEVLSEPSIVAT